MVASPLLERPFRVSRGRLNPDWTVRQ